MSLKVGVSGIRGIIGESLTDEVVCDFTKAYGTFLRSFYLKGKDGAPKVLVGRDTRASSEAVRKKVIEGLFKTGCSVTDLGLCPTPTLLFATRFYKADGAIIITASHNPAHWNGLKFVRSDGTFLTDEEAKRFFSLYNSKKFDIKDQPCVPKEEKNAIKNHIDEILKYVDSDAIKKHRFKVALDYCNGTGAVSTPYLLERLGCEVAAINATPDGRFAHNPEPVAENLAQLCDFVKKTGPDVGFAQDPDGDRLAIVSEKGEAIGEENTLALAVKHVLSKRKAQSSKLKTPKIVVNLSTSRMIDDIAKKFGATVFRTAVGETNVVSRMIEEDALIGGEGNGGVIYPAVNFGRDSFVAMALVLEYMAITKKRISELVSLIKQYQMEKTKMAYPKEKVGCALDKVSEKFKKERLNTTDGIRIDYKDGWVHIRPSNTEPVIRIIAEGETKEKTTRRIDIINKILRHIAREH